MNGREVKIGVRVAPLLVSSPAPNQAAAPPPLSPHSPAGIEFISVVSADLMCSVTSAAFPPHAHTMHGALQQSIDQ